MRQSVEWDDPLAAGFSHCLAILVMKMICFSCVLFMDELILAAMTDDVGGCLISLMLLGICTLTN